MSTLVGMEIRINAPKPSLAFYDAVVVATSPVRVVVKHASTGALEHVDRETGKVLQFDRQRGWIATGWTLHPADIEALRRADEVVGAEDVDRNDNLPRLQGEGGARSD